MDVNVDNIVISKLIKTKSHSKYLTGYLGKAIRVDMSGYVTTFKVEAKINKLMSFHIDDETLSEEYKAIWTKIQDLKKVLD